MRHCRSLQSDGPRTLRQQFIGTDNVESAVARLASHAGTCETEVVDIRG